MVKGAFHLHSTFSDGEFTLAELRELYLAVGCRLACITDHADSIDAVKIRSYLEECDRLSDARFRFLPGLEFTCERKMHVLGYGMTKLLTTRNPEQVIREIRASGGIAVIAHPKDEAFDWIESFADLPDGIEAWNTKYDGRYAPRPGTFQLVRRLRQRKPDLLAFYGQDLHWKKQYRGIFIELGCDSPEPQNVLLALRQGNYIARCGDVELASSGVVSEELLTRFSSVQQRSTRMRGWIRKLKNAADRLGIAVPVRLKAQLRRIF
jgi:predicted metal-dependent phosphoesterase TrpH